ncbi:ABC transporter permease [Ancrocorticia populi]|uniref:ABC transporter permease n=1 Tax=Ancrocorticia populi TaxID=2175228 RepID=UPI0023576650|nr:ABC transporter permease [Ancrocorticia populi]
MSTLANEKAQGRRIGPVYFTGARVRSRRRGTHRVPASVGISLVIVAVATVAVIWPGLLTGVDPHVSDPLNVNQAPSADHLFGTDALGRDVLARVVYGARYSLAIGVGATVLALAIGATIGLVSGISPRWLDQVLTRATDVIASFPEILLALVLVAFTGPGIGNLILALGVAGAPRYARLLRSEVKIARTSGYVEQARTFGMSTPRVVTQHILPNALGVIPVVATIGLGGAIIGAAALSFIGMGPQPPIPEWGSMLAESRQYLRIAWWTAVFPGVALTAIIVSSTIIGRYLQARHERRNS